MDADLTCAVCGTTEGTYSSYEEWSDRASTLGWQVGEDVVICSACVDRAQRSTAKQPAPEHESDSR